MAWFFKQKPKRVGSTECEHDWEVVEAGGYWRMVLTRECRVAVEEYHDKDPYKKYGYNLLCCYETHQAQNRVCVKCGKCDNEVRRFEEAYKKQERAKAEKRKAARRRKAWAKQLWEDGCANHPK